MELLDLPLFPLGTVLFPGYGLPLHIFEERYKALIADCMMGAGRFGVVGIEHGVEVGGAAQPYRVGTLAQITELDRLADGQCTLLAAGLERIRILDLDRTGKPYLRGRVELWPDEDLPAAPGADSAQVGALFNAYLGTVLDAAGGQAGEWGLELPLDLPADPRLLSALIGALIQASPADKQRLLEAPSAGARITAEIALLTRELTLMKTTQAAPAPNPAGLRGAFSNN
jgi:Lon protease-like protein